jgi:hypothetical protein
MPIDVSPPQVGNLQGFQIAPPQSTDPLQTLAQMSQLRTQGLQQQQAQLGLTQAQMQMASQKALMQSFVDGGGDWDKTRKSMYSNPDILPSDLMSVEQHRLQVQTQAATLDKEKKANLATDMDRYRGFLDGVTDQDSLDQANLNAAKAGVSSDVPRLTAFPGDAAHVKAFGNSLALHSQAVEEELKGAQTTEAGAKATESSALTDKAAAETAETQLKTKQLQGQLDWLDKLTPQGLADYVGASIDKTKYPDLYARAFNDASNARAMKNPAAVQAAIDKYAAIASEQEKTISTETDPRVAEARTNQAVATARATAPIKIYTAAGEATARADAAGLTDDDYARAGEQYMRTGVMPGLGRDSVTRGKIVKAGNQWARDNGLSPSDVVTMQAAYAGDKESLKKFQAQRDQIVSFEQTAQKNLDLFLNAASKIPDTGVPWLNKPLRELNQGLVGSENMAAVNAARQVANNEIAKVTSGGGLSGVLSDSARHEVESYNPANATFAQTKAVAQVLKQDMANRHGSMDATLSDIKARIGGGGGTQQQQATRPPAIPNSIPQQFRSTAHWSPAQNKFYYTTDGGKTWVAVPAQ